MRLLLVTWQIKKNGKKKREKWRSGKIIIIAVKMWKATHKAQKGGKWKETLEACFSFRFLTKKKERKNAKRLYVNGVAQRYPLNESLGMGQIL
jgi:hypothetical protein